MAHSRVPHETPHAEPDRLIAATRIARSEGRILRAGRTVHATLPKSYPYPVMKAAGRRFWERTYGLYPGAHIVALADSGVPLATGIVSTAPGRAVRSMVAVSVRHDYEPMNLEVPDGESIVIVDNAIHTGATATAAMSRISRYGQIAAFVKMFDYGDELEAAVSFDLFRRFGADIRSLYEISELGVGANLSRP